MSLQSTMRTTPGASYRHSTREELAEDLRRLGIQQGDLLHAKVSMRAVGPVDGSAATLVAAILDVLEPNGTLVSDAFIPIYSLPLSRENAEIIAHDKSKTYAGAFCAAMINHPRMVRSQHPIQKGVAIGAKAEQLMMGHTPEHPAYDHLNKMAQTGAKHITIGGKVVGVGTTHVAQNLLNLEQKTDRAGINYCNPEGEVTLFEKNWVGGCGNGFPKFFPLYRQGGAILAEGSVGQAQCMVTDMNKTLEIELEKLEKCPSFFFCNDPVCTYCRLSWEFSTGKAPVVLFRRFLRQARNKSLAGVWTSFTNWIQRKLRS